MQVKRDSFAFMVQHGIFPPENMQPHNPLLSRALLTHGHTHSANYTGDTGEELSDFERAPGSPTRPLESYSPRLYHTSISPLSVRTSMMVCPRKSSDSRFSLCLTRDLMSSSSSQTRTLMRSEELWHSLGTRQEQSDEEPGTVSKEQHNTTGKSRG